MLTDQPKSDDEFEEIMDCEEIQNTQITECINEPAASLNPDTLDADLLASFTMLIDFAFQIVVKIDRYMEYVKVPAWRKRILYFEIGSLADTRR